MAGRWFRLYAELVDDPKVQMLFHETFRGLINLWCLAANDENGRLPPIATIAFKLRMSEADAGKLIADLTAVGLLEKTENGLVPHNWAKRQFHSSVSTNRVRAFRERNGNGKRNVSSNVSETPPETEYRDREEGSEAKASGTPVPFDEREKLFSEGLKAIKRITGQPDRGARALIGRWLKVTGDDCGTIGRLIEDAERDRRADPVAWIEAHFKPRPAGGAPPGAKINPDGTFERWAL